MKQRPRIYYSAEQKNLMWDRWQAGDSLYEIARLFRSGTFLRTRHSCRDRGIRPRPRSRSRLSLTLSEREEISRGMVAGQSLRAIDGFLGSRAVDSESRD